MKKFIWLAIGLVLVVGGFFGIRAYYTSEANGIANRLEGTVEQCNKSLQNKDARFDTSPIWGNLIHDREAFAKLPSWAVSGSAKERFAAAAAAADKTAATTDQAIRDAKDRLQQQVDETARLAEADVKARREAREKEAAEAKREIDAQQAKITAAISGAHRPGQSAPATVAAWPLADSWPSELMPAKVLIWDRKQNAAHLAQQSLPDYLRGTPANAEMILCVVKEQLHQVTEYEQNLDQPRGQLPTAGFIGKVPGHRMWMQVRLIRYPSAELIGAYTLVGESPGREAFVSSDPSQRKEIVGEYQRNLTRWVEQRFGPAGPFEKFLRATDDAEQLAAVGEIDKSWDTIDSTSLPYLAKKLREASDPQKQYQLIRLVQIAKRENPDIMLNIPGQAAGPSHIGPANWPTFDANRALWLGRVQEWLKAQAPE